MSKRRIAYVKPEEPAFLKRMKQQAGYKEGPTVDTKKATLEFGSDDDYNSGDDEQPTVVVLKKGDLTAEQARVAQDEEENKVADLSKPIIFKSKKSKVEVKSSTDKDISANSEKSVVKIKKAVLSFNCEEDEDW